METFYQSCVLRVRYNISSADLSQWPEDSYAGSNPGTMVDHRNNTVRNGKEAPLTQDPYIEISPRFIDGKGESHLKFLSLAINTNQYGRTFQDRSYVFTIKPLPTSSNSGPPDYTNDYESFRHTAQTDIPVVDIDELTTRLGNGGRIIDLNVRGKRGNIVQTFPSVEYDFIPNSVKLTKNDIIHFQWTGSDYNPRRGCNNGEGGPPDPNTFSTAANANRASRADRSNLVFTDYMANNVPRDYIGYDLASAAAYNKSERDYYDTLLKFSPCANDSKPNYDYDNLKCANQTDRLAHLDQFYDLASIVLRNDQQCLTEEELNAILNSDERENHPLNCAKINAKPFPYFDGGLMFLRKSGLFSYFSSRNNNFSNRQQIGVICVVEDDGTGCDLDVDSGVLQDKNPQVTGTAIAKVNEVAQPSSGSCSATTESEANANGAKPQCAALTEEEIAALGESFFLQEGDNDNFGDGNEKGCPVLTLNQIFSDPSPENVAAIASVSLVIGLFISWLLYYIYNRHHSNKDPDSTNRNRFSWMRKDGLDFVADTNKQSVFSGTTSAGRFLAGKSGYGDIDPHDEAIKPIKGTGTNLKVMTHGTSTRGAPRPDMPYGSPGSPSSPGSSRPTRGRAPMASVKREQPAAIASSAGKGSNAATKLHDII
jgi:hypothetical protein